MMRAAAEDPSAVAPGPPSAPSDADLVRRARAADRWAEQALYRRHVGAIARTAQRLLGPGSDADDVVQETFAQAFEDLATLREPACVGAWLHRMAVHRVHRRFRRRKLRRLLGITGGTPEVDLAASAGRAPAEVRAELHLLSAALAEVSVSDRVAWMLRHVEGRALDEVAEACGCSLATVKRRIRRAQDRVDRHLRPVGFEVES